MVFKLAAVYFISWVVIRCELIRGELGDSEVDTFRHWDLGGSVEADSVHSEAVVRGRDEVVGVFHWCGHPFWDWGGARVVLGVVLGIVTPCNRECRVLHRCIVVIGVPSPLPWGTMR